MCPKNRIGLGLSTQSFSPVFWMDWRNLKERVGPIHGSVFLTVTTIVNSVIVTFTECARETEYDASKSRMTWIPSHCRHKDSVIQSQFQFTHTCTDEATNGKSFHDQQTTEQNVTKEPHYLDVLNEVRRVCFTPEVLRWYVPSFWVQVFTCHWTAITCATFHQHRNRLW